MTCVYSLYICLSTWIFFLFCLSIYCTYYTVFVLPICMLSDLGGNKISYLISYYLGSENKGPDQPVRQRSGSVPLFFP